MIAPKLRKEIDKIIEKTERWPDEAIMFLIDLLTCNVGYDPDFELTDEQIAELDRRIKEVESGKVKTRTWEEVQAHARRIIARGLAKRKNKK